MYEYNFKLLKIVDGDTVDGIIDLGFDVSVKKRVRLVGINAPETCLQRSIACPKERKEEKRKGIAAKHKLAELLRNQSKITIKTQLDKSGKFGRVLGTLFTHENDVPLDINRFLLIKGYVREYK